MGPPRRGGTLTVAADKEPDCYDPQVSPADVTASLMRNVYDSLIAQRSDGSFAPWLATGWKVSRDGTAYTFRLRRGVTFTDGTPFDATAVKTNLDRIVAPATQSEYAASLIEPYRSTAVVDRHTVRIRLSRPFAPFLSALSTTYLGFHSPRSLHAAPGALCAGGPSAVGTGPFRFVSHIKGQQAEFVRNPRYAWAPPGAGHQGPAYVDKLVFRFLPVGFVRIGALLSGQADVADGVPPQHTPTVRADRRMRLMSRVPPGVGYTYFLNTSRAPFADQRIRLAAACALDRHTLLESVYFGQRRPADSVLSPSTPGHHPSPGAERPDPRRAARLLDAAGWNQRDEEGYRTRNGHRLSVDLPFVADFTAPEQRTLDEGVRADLGKVGIEVRLTRLPANDFLPRRNAGRYDMVAFHWPAADPDVLRTLFGTGATFADGGYNASRTSDRVLDAWLRAASTVGDRTRRDALYTRIQRRIADHGYALPTAVDQRVVGVHRRVRGLTFDAHAWPLFQGAWLAGAQ
ncbi:ABC transporter substrate-binding protein [Streptomyces sp. RGM 3693]|uniref:ABC transporter substrate-binding protein n=1 Tax=Streptomyces sp. RGM 3693 TaxID=3413284 RepID=UPI003D2B7B7E